MDSPPKKRGRGRPPGSLNAKGSKKRGYVEEEQSSQDAPSTAHVLDVDFESEEILGGIGLTEFGVSGMVEDEERDVKNECVVLMRYCQTLLSA